MFNNEPSPKRPPAPRRGKVLPWLALALVGLCGCHKAASDKSAAAQARDMAALVVPGTVMRTNMPIYLEASGTVQAFNTVNVTVRVDGQLVKVAFTEGQDVHAGDLLVKIDPAPYTAALEQVQAKKLQDEAQLTNAKLDLNRDSQLLKDKIVTDQTMATQQALVDQLAATVKADQAAIDSAQTQLNYTTITAPIDGRCGIRLVDQGNIVHAADTNALVVIAQLHPISVIFTLPEQNAHEVAKRMSQGSLTVLAVGRDDNTVLDKGKLAVIDNQIDASTGTIKLKANFPNTDLKLWPGEFVNARLLINIRTNGLVVPATVIQEGPDGEYAFVIADDKAEMRPVKVAQIQDGVALIDSGLSEGEQVVVDGQYRLQAGSKVKLSQPDASGPGKSGGTNSTHHAKAQKKPEES